MSRIHPANKSMGMATFTILAMAAYLDKRKFLGMKRNSETWTDRQRNTESLRANFICPA
jgi:hypothetical protein